MAEEEEIKEIGIKPISDLDILRVDGQKKSSTISIPTLNSFKDHKENSNEDSYQADIFVQNLDEDTENGGTYIYNVQCAINNFNRLHSSASCVKNFSNDTDIYNIIVRATNSTSDIRLKLLVWTFINNKFYFGLFDKDCSIIKVRLKNDNKSIILNQDIDKFLNSLDIQYHGIKNFLLGKGGPNQNTSVSTNTTNQTTSKSNEFVEFGEYNTIYYGAPGSGKSFMVNKEIAKYDVFCRVTFHPEYDYSQFVGCYKPISERIDNKSTITYSYCPQTFTNLYVEAWSNPGKKYLLIIEEINRGNCAQIFGDIFQLLDRNKNGFSKYAISSDFDLDRYLRTKFDIEDYKQKLEENVFKEGDKEMTNENLLIALPSNLNIIATMNTSDQSLYPMDSAFKRRWNWKYVPIDYSDVKDVKLKINNKLYDWKPILKGINNKIYEITHSEDKQLGNRFIDFDEKREISEKIPKISEEIFVNKVLFYLWNEIYKDFDGDSQEDNIFGEKKYSDLFTINTDSTDSNKNKTITIMSEYVYSIVKNILPDIKESPSDDTQS